MKEILRTNDVSKIVYAKYLLSGDGIAVFELDVNTSVLEGSIGMLPRRLMVADDEYTRARRLLTAADVRDLS